MQEVEGSIPFNSTYFFFREKEKVSKKKAVGFLFVTLHVVREHDKRILCGEERLDQRKRLVFFGVTFPSSFSSTNNTARESSVSWTYSMKGLGHVSKKKAVGFLFVTLHVVREHDKRILCEKERLDQRKRQVFFHPLGLHLNLTLTLN